MNAASANTLRASYSFDAYDYGTRSDPAAAYAFARGKKVDIAAGATPGGPVGVTIDNSAGKLDFMAVTDLPGQEYDLGVRQRANRLEQAQASLYYWFALRECSEDTLNSTAQSLKFDDPCWTKAGNDLVAFEKTNPFQPGFLNTSAQQGAGSSAGMIANHKAAMELMGAWDPGVIGGLTKDQKPLPDLGFFPMVQVPGGQGDPQAIMGGSDGYSCSAWAPQPACSDWPRSTAASQSAPWGSSPRSPPPGRSRRSPSTQHTGSCRVRPRSCAAARPSRMQT